MANVGFQPSGDELEQALMDLGPLLGVNIKEEVTEEDANAAASRLNVPSAPDTNPGGGSDSGDGTPKAEGGADPLASIAGARCVLCQTTLAHTEGTPKLMECLHSACEPCVNAKIEEKQSASRDFLGAERITITCPACRLQCQPGNMIDQRFVIEKITADAAGNGSAVSGELQCNSCDDTEPATSYCVDCAEFICNNCVQAHQRLKITKDHTIKSKAEALADQQAAQSNRNGNEMFCNEHTQERLSLFCETCDRLTCRDCQLQHHRDHKYQFSSEMAAQARANISSLLSEVSYKRVLLGSAMKVIKDRQQLIADKKKALVHEITQTVVKLTNAINTRGKQLVLRLNEVCDSKQKTLSEKKDALEQLAAITDHCVEFVNGALQQGSDTAVLYTKRAVCAHLQRIKSRRADIPNPEIPVRITLAIDKLPDLLKVLSTIGGIVVDGKVEGGGGAAGGAQGPYHPPHAAAHAPPPHTAGHAVQLVPHASHAPHHQGSPHSAVVALQQVAMQQSYVTNHGANSVAVSGASSAVMSALQQQMRRATPLRHPHVTSTTHPHHVHGMNELNLRGLLNQSGAGNNMLVAMGVARGAAARPPAQHAMHHAYQQMIGAYASNAYAAAANNSQSGRRSVGGLRTPSPAPHYPAPPAPGPAPPPAKWHIPQHSLQHSEIFAGGFDMGLLGGSASAVPAQTDFKITLGRQHSAPSTPGRSSVPSAVTSTNPKTPSPSLNGAISSELDKVCAESVQDLMATIAKLDSNGVQVVAEPSPMPASAARSPAPSVHSSTDDNVGKPSLSGMVAPAALGAAAAPVGGGVGADPNEDWCAVCMDGGELMCCDKCPKVFHQYCHIPTIDKLPDETETWQCLLCVNFAEMPPEAASELREGQLSPRQMRIIERITLELYCQYEPSLAFREPVPLENLHYHEKISQPMCLDTIRMKLQPSSPARYTLVAHFVDDCRLMFRNALSYNPVESQIYKDAKRLEEFFEAQLMKWLPEYAYWSPGAMPQGASASFGEPGVKRARIE